MGHTNAFLPFLVSTPFTSDVYQWVITNNGSSIVVLSNGNFYTSESAIAGIDCNVSQAWNVLGNRKFTNKIAIISTGVSTTHPDLTNVLPGVTISISSWTYSQTDQGAGAGEGTAVAGVIAGSGSTTNDDGHITGIVPGAKILPASVQAAWLSHSNAWFWALTNYAKIIVLPWGYPSAPDGMIDLVQRSLSSNCIIVQAAPDCSCQVSTTNISQMDWPGSFYPEFQNVIAATSLSYDGTISSNAAFGSYLIAAPGRRMASTGRPSYSTYVYANGTSFAAPHVAGAVALVWAMNPTKGAVWVANRIRSTLDPLDGVQGKLNIGRAVGESCDGCPVIRPAFTISLEGGALRINNTGLVTVLTSETLRDWMPWIAIYGTTNIPIDLFGSRRFFKLQDSLP